MLPAPRALLVVCCNYSVLRMMIRVTVCNDGGLPLTDQRNGHEGITKPGPRCRLRFHATSYDGESGVFVSPDPSNPLQISAIVIPAVTLNCTPFRGGWVRRVVRCSGSPTLSLWGGPRLPPLQITVRWSSLSQLMGHGFRPWQPGLRNCLRPAFNENTVRSTASALATSCCPRYAPAVNLLSSNLPGSAPVSSPVPPI